MRTQTTAMILLAAALLAAPAFGQSTIHGPRAPFTAAAAPSAPTSAPEAQQPRPANASELPAPQAPVPPQPPKSGQSPRAPEAPALPDRPTPPFSRSNVRVDVTISDQSGSSAPTKKSISLTAGDGSRGGSVRSGLTIPIPSTTFASTSKEGGSQPLTSFTYKDVGLSLDVTDLVVQGNFIRLRIAVEYNPVDEKTVSAEGAVLPPSIIQGLPSFARFSQTLNLVLEDGKPLVVAQSSDPVPSRNRSASLEVKATIIK